MSTSLEVVATLSTAQIHAIEPLSSSAEARHPLSRPEISRNLDELGLAGARPSDQQARSETCYRKCDQRADDQRCSRRFAAARSGVAGQTRVQGVGQRI